MCYPCSHCGACKVRLDPSVCPACHEPVEPGASACHSCGFSLPLPPGQVAGESGHVLVSDECALPRAEEYGVVGSWQVPRDRPEL